MVNFSEVTYLTQCPESGEVFETAAFHSPLHLPQEPVVFEILQKKKKQTQKRAAKQNQVNF